MKKCPKCGEETDSKFCPECGTDLSAVNEIVNEVKVCPNCKTETSSKFCPECGTEVRPLAEIQTETKSSDPADKASDGAETEKNEAGEVKDGELTVEVPAPAASAAQEKKEKKPMSKTMKIVAIAAAALLVLLIGIGLGGGGNTTTEETTTTGETTTTEEPTVEEPAEEEPEEETSSSGGNSSLGTFTTEEDYESLDYDGVARNPDDYKGNKYTGSGTVLQVLESDTEVDMRVAVDGDYDNVIYLVYSPSIVDSRILEDDYVTFYGVSQGLYSYESTMGATITIPLMYVQKISVD